jgi:hypothetical protein
MNFNIFLIKHFTMATFIMVGFANFGRRYQCFFIFKYLILHHMRVSKERFRIKWQRVSKTCPKS